jgi:YidC/Oxa1 family membrane protein insertase
LAAIWNGFVSVLEIVLKFFYDFVPLHSAGLAIILFTVAVKIILMPLTVSQLRSSREMQKLQPKVKELQKKYAKDREKLNQEMMALYREHGVNPTQGCLPSLLQIPIFFGVYYAILNLTRIPTTNVLLGRWIGFDSLAFLGLGSIPTNLATGLQSGIFAHLPFLWLPTLGKPDPLHILPILAGVLQLLQQKMMTTSNADPQQKAMNNAMMFLPLMFIFIGWTFPAGPVVYWITQSLVGIVQQYFISGWGGLRQWLPFLPERKAPDKPAPPKPQEAVVSGAPTQPERGWFWRLMDRMSSLQESSQEQSDAPETGDQTPSSSENALPPPPAKRRSRR